MNEVNDIDFFSISSSHLFAHSLFVPLNFRTIKDNMDLQLYGVILIIFLVSLCTLLFVTKQLRGGKTYEEVVAEKRLLAEKLYGNKKKNPKKNATGKKVM